MWFLHCITVRTQKIILNYQALLMDLCQQITNHLNLQIHLLEDFQHYEVFSRCDFFSWCLNKLMPDYINIFIMEVSYPTICWSFLLFASFSNGLISGLSNSPKIGRHLSVLNIKLKWEAYFDVCITCILSLTIDMKIHHIIVKIELMCDAINSIAVFFSSHVRLTEHVLIFSHWHLDFNHFYFDFNNIKLKLIQFMDDIIILILQQ